MKSVKIFIACGLGGGLGALVALNLAPRFWWLGLIAGFITGYLSYNFRQVLSAICQAWQVVIGWRPDWELWKVRFEVYVWFALAGITFIFFIICLNFLWPKSLEEIASIEESFIVIEASVIGILVIFFGITVNVPREKQLDNLKDMQRIFKKLNPLVVYFHYLPKGILWIIKNIPKIIRFLKKGIVLLLRFVKMVFILVHSDKRLLCGFDAAIGAGIGYFAGNLIAGILAGGFIGVFNYEILSKRVLKLVPAKVKNSN